VGRPRVEAFDRIERSAESTYLWPFDLHAIERLGAGHTLRRHVAISEAALRDRALRTHHDVSSFTDEATAQRVVDEAFAENQRSIGTWLGSHRARNLELRVHADRSVGRVFRYDRHCFEPTADAAVILERTRRLPQGFTVLTAYPRIT
jgi:hypothetical protein